MSLARASAVFMTLALLPASASSQAYLWGFSSEGQVVLNGTSIAKLNGGASFDGDVDELSELSKYWNSLALDGADWWCLRFDGQLSWSGEEFDDLAYAGLAEGVWIDLFIQDGDRWALRTDGRVSVNENLAGTLPDGSSDDDFGYRFLDLAGDGEDVFVLRSDGRVYRNTSTPAFVQFNAPDGVFDTDNGESYDTEWFSMAIDPLSGDLYALRRDGYVYRVDPGDGGEGGPPNGIVDAALPFPNDVEDVDAGKFYWGLTFLDDGSWLAIRGDGKVYEEADDDNPLVDLPGQPDDFDSALYVDILGVGTSFVSLREDGRVYLDTSDQPIVDMPKSSFVEVAFSTVPPDLSNAKNAKPKVTIYKTSAITGEAITVPVLVSDSDTPPEDITVTIDEETLPPGMVWDPKASTLTWADPGPAGKYKVKLQADDGVNKPVKASFPFKVKDPDDDVEKDKKPVPSKINKAQALVGVPFDLPILAVDPDGDPITLSVDMKDYPFDAGATFDAKSGVFSWVAAGSDIGKVTLRVLVSAGELSKTLKVKFKVEGTLLAFPGGEP